MLEGLAVWCLFIYLLRFIGMPWNRATKSFAYLGGAGWLMFVWVGLINYTPMDISGGSIVQSPHIQLRPDSTNTAGKVKHIYIKPNQKIAQGQLIYEIEDRPYQIAFEQAKIKCDAAKIALNTAVEDVIIAKASYQAILNELSITENELASSIVDRDLQARTLKRYLKQNRVVNNTIAENVIDNQTSLVETAKFKVDKIKLQQTKKQVDLNKAESQIAKAELLVKSRQSDLDNAQQKIAKAKWDLDSTKVYAPSNGFVTNFILREGQLVFRAPRLQMYTEEKYVLMRVNHQAIRNVKPGQFAEFTSPVYPGKVFAAQVEGIVEATGEAQSNLLGFDQNVRSTTGKNLQNKHHFVRLKIIESEGYDLPVGSVGLAWISGTKPNDFLAFLDVIRGIILRMKSQLYYFYSF